MKSRTQQKQHTNLLSAPTEFFCPLTHKIMTDPVYMPGESYSYERSSLMAYFKTCAENYYKQEHNNRVNYYQRLNSYGRNILFATGYEAGDFVITSPVSGQEIFRQSVEDSSVKMPEYNYPEVIINSELKARIEEYQRLKPLVDDINVKNQALEAANNETSASNNQLKDQVRQLQAEMQDLKAQNSQQKEKKKKHKVHNKALGHDYAALVAEQAQAKEEISKLKAKNYDLTSRKDELVNVIIETGDAIDSMKAKNKKLKADIEELKVLNVKLTDENDELTKQKIALEEQNKTLSQPSQPKTESSPSLVSLIIKRKDNPIHQLSILSNKADIVTPTSNQDEGGVTAELQAREADYRP
jgi:DNA repair exonuclease SbcCD ATPase subunit